MSFFGVTREKIGAVKPIEGADRIELATLAGVDFQFVVAKGAFKPGDACLYFPLDALLPLGTAEKLGVAGKLSGKDKNRVKTVRLRGEISQGIVGRADLAPADLVSPEDLIAYFKVTKYEPQEILSKNAVLHPLPAWTSAYDIEGCERNADLVAELMDMPVHVTEKLEGSNFSVLLEGDKVMVAQRNFIIVEKEGCEGQHTWWKVAKERGVVDFAQFIQQKTGCSRVQVLGELCGPSIQGNIYKLTRHQVYLFDAKINSHYLSPSQFAEIRADFHDEKASFAMVPLLWSGGGTLREWLAACAAIGENTIKEAAGGPSELVTEDGFVPREGVVIRLDVRGDSMFLKQRCPKYLAWFKD
jgi:RNA ligase (TIGR02306 family)